jgi:hypothetical protein
MPKSISLAVMDEIPDYMWCNRSMQEGIKRSLRIDFKKQISGKAVRWRPDQLTSCEPGRRAPPFFFGRPRNILHAGPTGRGLMRGAPAVGACLVALIQACLAPAQRGGLKVS